MDARLFWQCGLAFALCAAVANCDAPSDRGKTTRHEPDSAPAVPRVGEAAGQHPGQQTFGMYCAACHTIGGGVKAGPDLKDVTKKRDRAWLKRWIADPQGMAASDADAKALVAEWPQFGIMAKMPVDGKIDLLIDYMEHASASGGTQEPTMPTLKVAAAKAAVSIDEPHAAVWESAPSIDVPVSAQNVAMPKLDKASFDKVSLQALSDGTMISWRVTWADDAADANVDIGRFSDAVALQLPLKSDPTSHMMGQKEGAVQILYWKALWQKDIDEHFQDVQDVHPNFWTDLYWFAEGEFPYPIPAAFKDKRSHQYFPAMVAGNPMSQFDRKTPVEELIAEGYGSLTHQPESVTVGRGVYKDGKWTVVFQRPLKTDDASDYQFTSDKGQLAVAVWQGAAANTGGRKHFSAWVPFEVAQ